MADWYPDDASLENFRDLWMHVPKEVCSEDEAFVDGDRLYYQRLRPEWRSPAPDVEAWFLTFDLVHMSTHFQKNGKRNPGRLPHHRIRDSEDDTTASGTYPKRLPLNFYDEIWLQTLDGGEREKLAAQPAIDLTFNDEVQRYVQRLIGYIAGTHNHTSGSRISTGALRVISR